MIDWRRDRIGSALRGENPAVLARLPEGFAVIVDVQWLPGYRVLLSDDPGVSRGRQRAIVWTDATGRARATSRVR
jgi:hypothetical protein